MPAVEFDPVQEIQLTLREYAHVHYEASARSVLVHPADASGFPVAFDVYGDHCVVTCLGWHQRFDDPQNALGLFSMTLSGMCRLEVWSRGDFAYRWIMQLQEGPGWKPVSEVAKVFTPFWRRRKVVRLQNHLLRAA